MGKTKMKFDVSFFIQNVYQGMSELRFIPPIGIGIRFKEKMYKVVDRTDYLDDELGYDCSDIYLEPLK